VRLITPADDELYGLASAAGKLGRADRLLAMLEREHLARPGDGEAAGRYALAMMAVLPSVNFELAAHAPFTAAIDAWGRVLAIEPDHWFARYGRARLQTLTPGGYGLDSAGAADELASARADLDFLIDLQSGLGYQPYFVSTHALATVLDGLCVESARVGRPSLADELAACPRVNVRLPALGAVLCEPLVTLYAGSAERERHAIGEVAAALYGDQAAVAALRRSLLQCWPGRWAGGEAGGTPLIPPQPARR
jgi:hypothetical protein